MEFIYIFGIVALINVIFLSGCSREEVALKEFKISQAGSEIAKCAGATGSLEWKIFTSPDQKNPNVRVIEANLTKGNGKQKTLTIQWLYNLETKISELVYASKDGKKTNHFSMALEVASFCI